MKLAFRHVAELDSNVSKEKVGGSWSAIGIRLIGRGGACVARVPRSPLQAPQSLGDPPGSQRIRLE